MLALTPKTTTFLAYLTLVLTATAIAEAHESPLYQRDHVQLKRFIKKRAPQFDLGDIPTIIGAAPIPSSSSESVPAESESSSLASASLSASSVSASISASASESVSAESSVSSAVSSSASVSASEVASSSTSSRAETTPQVTQPPAVSQERSTSTIPAQTKTLTRSIESEPSAPPSMAGAAAADQNKSNIVTILIGVAASIGGVFILWTVFRKWKLGSSKKFDKRLQPIDWEKPGHDDVPHRRQSGSSFHSSGHGSARGNNGFSNVPEHDFTAGPSHLSPVGGYADMSRGPSPGPQFAIPSHHQSGYGRY